MTRPKTVGLGSWIASPGRSGYSALITCPTARSPRPRTTSSPWPSGESQGFGRFLQLSVVGRIQPAPAYLAGQNLLTQRETHLLLFMADPLLDLVSRPRRVHVAQPVPAGSRAVAGQDFYGVAITKLAMERRDPAVDLGTLAAQPDLGWTMKAKSIGVAPLGNRLTSPCGVKTKISSW